MTVRIRIFQGRSEVDAAKEGLVEPTEVVELDYETPYVWQDDPHYSSPPLGVDIHPDDCPSTLYMYSEDSVRAPPVVHRDDPTTFDEAEWGRPVERGLPFYDYDGEKPFGLEIWGRVLFYVEEGNTRD